MLGSDSDGSDSDSGASDEFAVLKYRFQRSTSSDSGSESTKMETAQDESQPAKRAHRSTHPTANVRRKQCSKASPEDCDGVPILNGSEESDEECGMPYLMDTDEEEDAIDAIWFSELASELHKEDMKEEDRATVSKHFVKCTAGQKAQAEARETLACAYISTLAPKTITCVMCGEADSVIKCSDCAGGGGAHPCAACDTQAHPYAHFHRRQLAVLGCWQPVAPTIQYNCEEEKWLPTRTYLRVL